MRNRIKYSQNFIKDINLVQKLVSQSSIDKTDTVVEIGAGDGIITSILANHAKNIIAYEIDQNCFARLASKFKNTSNIQVKNNNFLTIENPEVPYKIFSNIPFNITANIMKKLFLSDSSPSDAFLILQREAALKFIGKPFDIKNSFMAVLIHPWFESKVIYEFNANDFFPRPNVKIILVNIKKRETPLIEKTDKENYFDFVAHTYNQFKPKLPGGVTQSELSFDNWIRIFKERLKEFKGAYSKLLNQQKDIEKIHRTRVDNKWRDFT